MPGRGPLLNVRTAARAPFGFFPIWTALGAPARNTTSHSLMPSAMPPPNKELVSAAAGALPGWLDAAAPGAGAAAAAGGGHEPFAATRSLAMIGWVRALDSWSSENV